MRIGLDLFLPLAEVFFNIFCTGFTVRTRFTDKVGPGANKVVMTMAGDSVCQTNDVKTGEKLEKNCMPICCATARKAGITVHVWPRVAMSPSLPGLKRFGLGWD